MAGHATKRKTTLTPDKVSAKLAVRKPDERHVAQMRKELKAIDWDAFSDEVSSRIASTHRSVGVSVSWDWVGARLGMLRS